MPDSYPFYHSLVEQLAAKVITRIAQDGAGMEEAIKEAIHFADLDRQQVIHLCFTLQEYGLSANNDPKNYFYVAKDMGKAFPSVDNGYVVYAGQKTNLSPVFAAVEELKKIGFTNEEITDINPELDSILQLIDDVQVKYFDVLNQHEPMQMAASVISRRSVNAQAAPADVQAPTLDNLNQVEDNAPVVEPDAAPAPTAGGDETFFDDEEAADKAAESDFNGTAGGATVTISPSPEELKDKISKAPKWTVENVLSIDKAKAYYEQLKKDLEEIVLNDKITIGEDLMQQYNEQRSAIDESINKIDDAQKDTKKLEKKENDLETQYEDVPAGDVPTEGQIAGEEGAAPLAGPPPAPAAPAPAPVK